MCLKLLKINPNDNKQLYILDLKTYELHCCFARPHISPLLIERLSSLFISSIYSHINRENEMSLDQLIRVYLGVE